VFNDRIFSDITPVPRAAHMIDNAFAIYVNMSPREVAEIQTAIKRELTRIDTLPKNVLTDYMIATLEVFQAYIDLWRRVRDASERLGYKDAR
jgi:hypothetical protein